MAVVSRLVHEGAAEGWVRQNAIKATSHRAVGDQVGMCADLLRFTRGWIRHREDPDGYDTFQAVSATRDQRTGDCVDQSVYLASHIRAAGVMAWPTFVDNGGGIEHCMVVAQPSDMGGALLPLDPINYSAQPGDWPPGRLLMVKGPPGPTQVEEIAPW